MHSRSLLFISVYKHVISQISCQQKTLHQHTHPTDPYHPYASSKQRNVWPGQTHHPNQRRSLVASLAALHPSLAGRQATDTAPVRRTPWTYTRSLLLLLFGFGWGGFVEVATLALKNNRFMKTVFFWNWLCWCNMFINSSLFIHASQTFQLLFLAVQLTPKSQFQKPSFTSNLKFENLMIKMKIKISAYLMPRDNTCILATIKWYCQFPHMRIQHRTTSANAGGFEKNSGKSFILGITASRQVPKSCGCFKGYNGINRYFYKRTKARVCLENMGSEMILRWFAHRLVFFFENFVWKILRWDINPPICIAWDERCDSPLLR